MGWPLTRKLTIQTQICKKRLVFQQIVVIPSEVSKRNLIHLVEEVDESGLELILKILYIFKKCSIYFLRQRETEHEQGRGREKGRHRIRSRLQAVSTELDAGLELLNQRS